MKTDGTIGQQQRKHTGLRTKAEHYRRMALAIQANTLERHTFPTYVPRGKPPEWYRAKAAEYERQSETAGELASALVDLEHQQYLDRITPERAANRIEGDFRALDYMLDHLACDWPKLASKLSTDQREAYAAQIQRYLRRLIAAVTGG
jgi:hypothetical protein